MVVPRELVSEIPPQALTFTTSPIGSYVPRADPDTESSSIASSSSVISSSSAISSTIDGPPPLRVLAFDASAHTSGPHRTVRTPVGPIITSGSPTIAIQAGGETTYVKFKSGSGLRVDRAPLGVAGGLVMALMLGQIVSVLGV